MADATLHYDVARLRAALDAARCDAADICGPRATTPAATDFRYVDLRDGTLQTIPAAAFGRQYGLCLHSLELTIHGYAVSRRVGFGQAREIAFSTRPPPRWRGVPPLLALRVQTGPGGSAVSIAAARGPAGISRQHLVVHLDAALQEQVLRAVGAPPPDDADDDPMSPAACIAARPRACKPGPAVPAPIRPVTWPKGGQTPASETDTKRRLRAPNLTRSRRNSMDARRRRPRSFRHPSGCNPTGVQHG